ncbi:MAG: aldo/keto reductase, partial [Myxococcota bacterium]
FDFELSADEMASINALSRDQRFGPDPRDFDF